MSLDGEFTRLYRSQPSLKSEAPEWIRRGLIESGHVEAEGRWFVADTSLLDWYREDANGPTRTLYVDVPTANLESYRVSNCQEQIGRRTVKSYSRDPENEFFLPRELAAQAKDIAVARVYNQGRCAPSMDDDCGMSR